MAGALAFYFLPVAPMPQVEYPTLNVMRTCLAPVRTRWLRPLRRHSSEFRPHCRITEMTSQQQHGAVARSRCSSIWIATSMRRPATYRPRSMLPAGNCRQICREIQVIERTIRRISPSSFWQLTSDVEERSRIYDVADSILDQKIAQISGVGQVNIQGSSRPAVRVQINPTALTKYDIGWEQIQPHLRRPTPTARRASYRTDNIHGGLQRPINCSRPRNTGR